MLASGHLWLGKVEELVRGVTVHQASVLWVWLFGCAPSPAGGGHGKKSYATLGVYLVLAGCSFVHLIRARAACMYLTSCDYGPDYGMRSRPTMLKFPA
jgi:hypothetical protein